MLGQGHETIDRIEHGRAERLLGQSLRRFRTLLDPFPVAFQSLAKQAWKVGHPVHAAVGIAGALRTAVEGPDVPDHALQQQLLELSKTVNMLLARLDQIESSTTRMAHHIGFVESVYANIKAPFHHLLNMVSRTPVHEIEMTPVS